MNVPTRIVIVGPLRWWSASLFNGNAFPSGVSTVVDACASRLTLLLLHTSKLGDELEREITEFKTSIEKQSGDLKTALRSRPEITSIAVFEGLAYISEVHACLNALKSFLDVYAKLIGKTSHPPFEASFGKANIDGSKVSGGRLINALRNSCTSSTSQDLAKLTLQHSTDWITTAVKYRDQLSHRSDLDHGRPLQLPLSSTVPYFDFSNLQRPTMPNGQDLEEYFERSLHNLVKYVRSSLPMLPSVDLEFLNLDAQYPAAVPR